MSARTEKDRVAAVARVRAGERVALVAAEAGVHPSTVRRWVKLAPPQVHEPDPFMSALLGAMPTRPSAAQPEPPVEAEAPVEPEAAARPEAPAEREAPVEPAAPVEPEAPSQPEAPGEPEALTQPEAPVEPEAPALTETVAGAPAKAQSDPEDEAPLAKAAPEDDSAADASDVAADDEKSAPTVEDQPGNAIVEQLQVLATAPADAIVRIGNRMPIRDRYALVITAWFACLLVAWVAPDSHPGRPILLAMHLLAMTVAFGSVMALDWHGILWERRHREIKESIRLSHALSPLIWGGLSVLFITGGLLGPDLSNPLAWLKLISVLVLALNGVATSQLRRHLANATSDGLRSLAPRPRSQVIFSSVLSQVCWLTAVVVGLATTMSR